MENEVNTMLQDLSFGKLENEYQELMEKCEWYKYLCEKTNVYIECVVLAEFFQRRLDEGQRGAYIVCSIDEEVSALS